MKSNFRALALALLLAGLMTPAMGISVGFSAGNGGTTTSSSSSFSLDRSASLHESASIGNGEISKDLTAIGSGNNRISISSSTKEKTAGIDIESSGNFQTSASTGASGEGVGISQGTTMSGSYGGITARSDSPENEMVISTGFEGQGDLTAGISAAAGENAAISGNVNALGVEMLDGESMQALASGDIILSVEGLSNGGLGNFGLSGANINKGMVGSDTSASLTGPAYTSAGGDKNAYTTLGYRWNKKDPQIKWVLKNDAYMTNEGLKASAVQSAIAGAANTWDDATNQNLFADSNLVTLNPTVATEKYNKINTINWKPFGSAVCLAYAKTYYSTTKVGGYKSALDSDLVFNTDYSWRTGSSTTGFDVQTVALHEMGHTLGLGDLYTIPAFKYDTDQVMHYYTTEKHALGNGDKAGIWKLYG